MWLLGEAGSGKSRLLREFAARVEPAGAAAGHGAPPHPRVVWLRPDVHARLEWQSVAGQVFGIAEAEDERNRTEKVRSALQRLIPGEPSWHQLVLASLGLVPDATWRRLERRSIHRKLQAWRDVFAALAHEDPSRPLLVISESDRFDPDLDLFVELLLRADAPLLVVRAARNRDLGASADVLTLGPLSPEESMSLFLHFADPTFERAGRALIDQVGGNPTSVFELGLALTITQETHFRGSLTSLLQTRLDLLEPRARRLLALAATCGERTWEGLLRAVHGDVAAELQALCRDDVLVRQPSSSIAGDAEFRFRSELLRHAVLEMTPFADRPDLHLRVASWLEQEAPLAFSEAIGEHFERGGAPDAAYAHFLAAAAEAEAADDRPKTDRLFAHIAELDVAQELRAQGTLVYAQTALNRGDAALAERQLDLAAELPALSDVEDSGHLRATEKRLRDDLAALRRGHAAEPAPDGMPAGGGSPDGVESRGDRTAVTDAR
jgi:hypothetical protein